MHTTSEKLKLGLLIDNFQIPFWAYEVVSRIMNSDYATVTTIIHNTNGCKNDWGIMPPKNFSSLLYRKFLDFENARYNPQPNAFKPLDVKTLLADTPVITAQTGRDKSDTIFEQNDIDAIHQQKLDVIFKIGKSSIKGAILKAARYGIWTYHHSENPAATAEPHGLWEVLETHPTTGVSLVMLGDSPEKHKTIYRSYSSTDQYSFKRNRNIHYNKSISFLPRRLETLHKFGENAFFERVQKEDIAAPMHTGNGYGTPVNSRLFFPLAVHMRRQLQSKLAQRSHFYQWMLYFDFGDDKNYQFKRYQKILPPKDRLWADPFVEYRDGIYYVFIEEALFNPKKGYLSVFTINESGEYSKPETIIEQPYHMSYPQVIHWEGVDYMIPETSSNRTVELYKCMQWPNKWEFQYNLMEDIRAVDGTLFFHNDKWWLFANIAENQGSNTFDELFLFYSDSPISQNWTPHPLNPIISDTRRARPAGKIFTRDGKIYRPSQNCEKRYGYGLKINEVITLNTNEYEEREVHSFLPDWDKNIRGVHTINKDGKLTLIDAVYWREK